MAASANGDAAPAPAPFSYAQAAKGRASTSAGSAPAVPSVSPAKETQSWTDDSFDAHTTVEEPPANSPLNGLTSVTRGVEKTTPTVQQPETVITVSHPSSPQYDSSATTAREEDIGSLAKLGLGSAWDHKSSSDELPQDTTKQVDSTGDSNKELENEESGPKAMKEAPIPVVNFWQKRAEEAKAKQTATTATTTTATAPPSESKAKRSSQSVKPNGDQPATATVAKQGPSNGVASNVADASAAKNRTSKPGRAPKPETNAQTTIPLPPTRDESAWPTPIIARDEDRRKAQEKEEKGEKERPLSAVPKTHGKSEWVHVPYTPSVKFNTPLPPTRGRGRGGSRGGRGGSANERASVAAGAPVARDEATLQEARGRPENEGRRASIQAPNGSRTPSSSQTTNSDKRANAALNKRQSLQDDSSLSAQNKGELPAQGHAHAGVAKQSNGSEPAIASLEGASGVANPGSKSKISDGQPAERGKAFATQGESTSENTQQTRTKRHSTFSNDQRDAMLDDKETRTQIASDQSSSYAKQTRPDGRNGSNRSFEGQRDAWGTLPFRDGRTERGRGRGGRGSHYSLSHHATNQIQNSTTLAPIQTNGPYSARSSSGYQTQYFSHGQPSSDRRSFPSGSRSASIPGEFSYGRFAQAFPGNQPQAVYSSYVNAAYDYNVGPMSAIPYNQSMDQSMVITGVTFQLNYYFSLENLLKDVYLRKRMDSQGFVSLNFIANFQRMKDLTTDLELIKYACMQSPEFELRQGAEGQPRIRIKEGWDKWVLNMDERDASAQNDGPAPSEQLKSHPQHTFDLQSATRPAFPAVVHQRLDGSMAPFGGAPSFQPVPVTTPLSGARTPQELQSPPVLESGMPENQYDSIEQNGNGTGDYGQDDADSFPNSRIQFLTVAVRPYGTSGSRRISRSDASRTFSNGSISMEELKLSDGEQTRSQSQTEESSEEDQLQKVLNSRRPALSPSPKATEALQESVELFWFKGLESRQPLPSNGNTELYLQLHAKALEEREHAEPGSCPHDLDVLYQFWSHFLIRNFNTSMYNEFRQLAHDDAAQGLSNVGMQSLITFYSEALSSQQPIRDRVARHYLSLVKSEDQSKGRPAFEQLKSAWRNGALNMKNRKRISAYVDSELREELDKADR